MYSAVEVVTPSTGAVSYLLVAIFNMGRLFASFLDLYSHFPLTSTTTITGNIKFRALVEQHRARYHSASRVEKGRVVAEVVQIWRSMAPPGRFLTPKDPKLGDASTFVDIGDKAAQKKTAKRLRESLPESTTTTMASTVVSMSSNSSTSSSSDNDSSSFKSVHMNENNKRGLVVRRVSSDSMEKAAKRARMEYLTTATSELVEIPSMKLLFEAPTLDYTSNNDWSTAFLESALENAIEESCDDLDLDSLLEEDDMEPIFQTNELEAVEEQQPQDLLFNVNNMESWLSSNNVDTASMFAASAFDIFGGSIALNEIAGSIPSAACLTEGHIFD